MGRVIAIDFGTTHTYITTCSTESINTTCVQLGGNESGIETTILYCDLPNSPLIGKRATHEFGEAPDNERKEGHYQFKSHFKPDILVSEEARRCTVDFLKGILLEADHFSVQLAPLNARVIIGVPCEATQEYQNTLKQLAAEAGFGDVELIQEPIGALFDELQREDIPFERIMAGLLVIDFGGGTCDFAYMKHGRVTHSWGEMELGGRLFDDLFYQWFCEMHPDKKVEMEANGRDFFVRTRRCRELKENFSDMMCRDKTTPFRADLGRYGQMEGMIWEEFQQRARSYTPSTSYLRHQEMAGITVPETIRCGSLDLIGWYTKSLEDGLKAGNIAPENIHAISLAGGSSKWCFVKEICLEKLGVDKSIISQNSNPYAAISKGIAVYPALRNEFVGKIRRINEHKPEFIENEICPLILNDLNQCRDQIIEKISDDLFDVKIKPRLIEFRKNGGKIVDLKKNIASDVVSYEPILTQGINDIYTKSTKRLYQTALEKTRNWFSEMGLELNNAGDTDNEHHDSITISGGSPDPEIAESIVATIALIVGAIGTLIIAAICGGAGTAIIAAGPLGLLIGLIIGAVIMSLGFIIGEERAREIAENRNISWVVLYPILTDAAIDNCKQKLRTELIEKLDEENKTVVDGIRSNLEKVIQHEIGKLSEVNVL